MIQRTKRPRPISAKREAQRRASGEKFLVSSVSAGGKKPRKVNPKRRASEFSRCYHSKQRVAWVKGRPCLVRSEGCDGSIDNAHVIRDESQGMGRKAGYQTIAPLCRRHHRILHDYGVQRFEGNYGVSLAFAAAQTDAAWQRFGARGDHQ